MVAVASLMACYSLVRSAAAFVSTRRNAAALRAHFPTICVERRGGCPLYFSSDPMRNLYAEWSAEDDRLLWENRDQPLPKLASMLGRGLRGVGARLDKLKDIDSPAYERLFVHHRNPQISDDSTESKGKLTPAMEVLRRIRWDGTLSQSDFTIMYYDRVDETIEEAKFDAANESVKGKEELFVFAIPEHRIVGVKYKERIVWDKDRRIDCVFGSMRGNGVTIDVVIEKYDDWKREKDQEEAANRARQAEVSTRVRSTLGDQRFEALKDLSSHLQHPTGSLMATDQSVEEYVKSATNLFRAARAEGNGNGEEEDAATRRLHDIEALDLLSELVALLPDDILRERILLTIESTVDRIEGRKQKKSSAKKAGQDLPELNEDDLVETFVRGSGAGGQKVNKTANKVMLVHTPTQCRVECQETRSLQQNRKIARKRLRLKVDEYINGKNSRASIKTTKAVSKKAKAKARNKARQRKKKEAAGAGKSLDG